MSQDFPIPRQDGVPRPGGPGDGPTPVPGAGPDQPPTPDGTVGVVSLTGPAGGGGSVGRTLGRLHRDGRAVPVVGALGGLAVFGSLVEDWSVVRVAAEIDIAPENEVAAATAGVSELFTFGPAYLLGVCAVTACLTLVLFGSPASRRNARVAGLALAGAVLGVLVAVASTLDTMLIRRWDVYGQFDGVTAEPGRGLVLAFAGTGLLGLALLLAGPFVRTAEPTVSPDPGAGTPEATSAASPDWPWHRPRTDRSTESDDDSRPAPLDLTVTPTKPFVS